MPIEKIINAMSTIQSSSPIEIAAKSQTRLFILYVAVLVVGGIAAAIMTVFVYRAGNRYQSTVQADADARIKTADTRAAEARAESDKANAGLAESKVEIVRLTAETEKAKTERAEADKHIAIAKADAARAKEGIANAEARSTEASVQVSRLRVTVANAEKERAQAQTALLKLQQRLADRVITDTDARRIIEKIKQYKNREFDVVTYWDDREPLAIANRVADVLIAAGWKLDQPKGWRGLLGGTTGILVYFHPEASPEAKQAAEALVSAFNSVGYLL